MKCSIILSSAAVMFFFQVIPYAYAANPVAMKLPAVIKVSVAVPGKYWPHIASTPMTTPPAFIPRCSANPIRTTLPPMASRSGASAVNAGPGLVGGGSAGDVTISLPDCSVGQVLVRTPSGWECGTPPCIDGDYVSCYTGPPGTRWRYAMI